MKPSFILQVFKRTGAWLTPNGWLYLGGATAGLAFALVILFRWQ